MGAYNILANWYLENISIDTLIGYRALCNRISYYVKGEKPTPLGVGWIAKGLDMSLILSLIHSLE